MDILRANQENREELLAHFELVLKHTFEINHLMHMNDLLLEEIQEKRRYFDAYLEDTHQSDRLFLIGCDEGRIVACIEFSPSNPLINECTNGVLKDVLEIGTVFVHPNYQKQGRGSLLIEAVFKELRNRHVKQVCLDSGYKSAQKIWTHKFGPPQYFYKDYWGQGDHHMIWVVDVEPFFQRCD